ncbi:TetR/AcrR family transcriptional regulator [Sinomonas sp. ASV322]|uniref:TetR/AcrR family transcriptional regulator n=1 Tax=Sinomonas sp. ASV322 TaxID=3041920 RepID=UPI0027DC09D4|nr:TetR/AcrR family transcriptional regulator [Sinomonas sp. ASV322]MDQ4503433.1 TetR/AcrR family transcriptional regulator [Sinomonas sp. ASV322]
MARTRDVEGQRARLSAATWQVLAEGGLSALTLRAVAERAGCTTGLVLHAFPNKRALLLHARQLLHERANSRADAIETRGGEPRAVLRDVLLAMLTTTAEGHDEARVWVSFLVECIGDRELCEVHVAGNRFFLERVTRLVQACRPRLNADAARTAAVQLVGLMDGLNTLSVADPESYSPDRQRAALDAAIAGITR